MVYDIRGLVCFRCIMSMSWPCNYIARHGSLNNSKVAEGGLRRDHIQRLRQKRDINLINPNVTLRSCSRHRQCQLASVCLIWIIMHVLDTITVYGF